MFSVYRFAAMERPCYGITYLTPPNPRQSSNPTAPEWVPPDHYPTPRYDGNRGTLLAARPRPQTVRYIVAPPPQVAAPVNHMDRLIAEGFGLLLAYTMWAANAFFTITGFVALGVAWPIGLLIHIGISRWQHTLWRGRFDPVVLLLGCCFVLVDILTTLFGMVQLLTQRYPDFAGSLPADLRQWGVLLSGPLPEWWPAVVVLLVLSAIIALSSEYLIRKFCQRLTDAWMEAGM
ncbi:MAG: hypothetical protein HC876_19225 [Chloroflexaceae bacterium]|nr:hypothetical protein [Chloroflexaceae bacterium]